MEFHLGELEQNLSLFFFQVFVVASLLIFPIGICMILIASVGMLQAVAVVNFSPLTGVATFVEPSRQRKKTLSLVELFQFV